MINNLNTQEIVDFALKNFPTDLQIDILQEECAELIKALSKYKRENYPDNMTDFKSDSETRNSVIEEMSHVLISMDVVATIVKISESDIQNEINKKVQKYCPDMMNQLEKMKSDKVLIVNAIMKSLSKNDDMALAYSHIVGCSDCPYWHECGNMHDCYFYILDKLEEGDGEKD